MLLRFRVAQRLDHHRGLTSNPPSRRSDVVWALGLHPCELRDDDPRVEVLLSLLDTCDAVGEVGLDYSSRATARQRTQRAVLDQVLSHHAVEEGRIVTLHSVGATGDIIAAINTHPVPGAVLHWFLGSPAEVDEAIDADAYFSVNLSMLRSRRGRAALEEMPPNRVLAETDAPYAGYSAASRRPGNVVGVEAGLAKLWKLDPEEVRERLWANLGQLQARLARKPFLEATCT